MDSGVDFRMETDLTQLRLVEFPGARVSQVVANRVAGQSLSWTVYANLPSSSGYWQLTTTVDRFGISLDGKLALITRERD
jgi:hypothetical protein